MLACFRYTCGYQYHTRASFIIIFIILEIDFIFELLTYNRENDRTFKQGFTVKHSHSQNPESTCSNQMVYNLIRSNTRAPEKGEGGGVNRVNAYSISLFTINFTYTSFIYVLIRWVHSKIKRNVLTITSKRYQVYFRTVLETYFVTRTNKFVRNTCLC